MKIPTDDNENASSVSWTSRGEKNAPLDAAEFDCFDVRQRLETEIQFKAQIWDVALNQDESLSLELDVRLRNISHGALLQQLPVHWVRGALKGGGLDSQLNLA